MVAARWVGLILIVVGTIGLIWGGITYTRREKAVDFGPIEINVEKEHKLPIPPVVGGFTLAAGVALVTIAWRRR